METSIDRFGRVVIPQHLRESLGLRVGESLVIEKRSEGILLRRAREGVPLRRKGRVLVFTGRATGGSGNLLRRAREERLQKFTGRGRR